jgi:phosphoglycolate phosphatase
LLSAGTFLEYRELIQDIKNRIENIFHSRITIFHGEVSSKKKEQIEKQLELEIFDNKVKSLTRKNENILVVFDVDGTIFKAKEIFLPAIKQVLSENDIHDYTEHEFMKFIGMPYKEFEDWQQQLTTKTSYKEFKSRLQELELRNIISDGELYEGVIELFTILKEAKYTLAICTNARKEYLEAIFNKFKLFNYFTDNNIIYPERFSPYADKQYMLGHIKQFIKPFKSYMIGDRFYDSEAAQKNGFTFIGVNYGYGYDEIKNQTNLLVDKICEIKELLVKL